LLAEILSSASVPEDLVYFRDGARNLVVNPELGTWQVVDHSEFDILRKLANDELLAGPASQPVERALAKLVMSWIIYLPGKQPVLRQADAPLKMLYYAITEGCNLRCPYCYASSEKPLPGELSTAESLDLMDQAAEMGAEVVVFTGGEPMMRRDLFAVAARAKELGLRANIITNATLIRKPEMARKVAETFSTVTVSVDGGTAETHERTRGKGTFAKTVAALRMLNAEGVRPIINHVITQENVDLISDLAELISDIDVAKVRAMHHSDLGRGAADSDSFGWAEYRRLHKFTWTDPRAANLMPDGPVGQKSCQTRINCGLGGNEIYVSSLGNVYPCKLVTGTEHLAGNLRKARLRDLFASPVLADLRSNAVFAGDNLTDCRRCYIRGACAGGCRAYHMAASGSLKRNSRALCRILRHQMITSMWISAGAGQETILDNENEAFRPLLVATGEQHPVYDDWKAELAAAARPTAGPAERRQLPLSVVAGAR
jgi:radical SAM protein with 4Fe4S-binding SPASM domain